MNIQTILVATDYSEDAHCALETAIELAERFDSRIVLLHAFSIDFPRLGSAIGGGVFLPDGFSAEYRAHAMRKVDRLAKERAGNAQVQIQGVAIQLPPWMAIVEQCEKLPSDLVVMGARGVAGLMHLALGSTAEQVVRRAVCPVLTVRAGGGVD